MTQREQFKKEMIKRGFTVSNFQGQPFQGQIDLIPHHRKTTGGHHNIISGIRFVIWGGNNVKTGGLGCVTFYYRGKQRQKYCKNVHNAEILKKAFCPETAKEAIQTFDIWNTESQKTIQNWRVIL